MSAVTVFGLFAPEHDTRTGRVPSGGRDVKTHNRTYAFGPPSSSCYTARNPATGRLQRKVTFVKRVVVYGLPILLASGYYLD